MNISQDIEFDNIEEKDFKEFLEVLKKKDPREFAQESADGFLDLYNYWNGVGGKRFRDKLKKNKEALGL